MLWPANRARYDFGNYPERDGWVETRTIFALRCRSQAVALLDRGALRIAVASPQQQQLRHAIRRNVRLGTVAALLLVGVLGLWAATSSLSGAVVATGHLVVDSNVKSVQHPQGGVVGALTVKNGSVVSAGDVLVRLDDTVAKANLAIVDNGLAELAARRARLIAERDGLTAVQYPAEMIQRQAEQQVAQLIEGENRLFALRRQAREGQVSQLRRAHRAVSPGNCRHRGTQASKKKEIALIEVELKGVEELWKKKLVSVPDLPTGSARRRRSTARMGR